MRPEPSHSQAKKPSQNPLPQARLASALVSAFAAIDMAACDPQDPEQIRKAAIHLRRFLNQAIFEGEIDLQEIVGLATILLNEVCPHQFKEPFQPCCNPFPPL